MAALQLALLLLLTVLASAILDQIIPKFSLPLIQIALGVGIALLAKSVGCASCLRPLHDILSWLPENAEGLHV